MGLFRELSRAYMINRLARGRRRGYGMPFGYPRRPTRGTYWYGRRRPRSQVRVTGCCLPIPLALTVGATAGTASAVRRRRAA
jgi:hypothetical protein